MQAKTDLWSIIDSVRRIVCKDYQQEKDFDHHPHFRLDNRNI